MATLADILRQTGYSQDGTLAAPASVEPTMTSILQKHIANLPQKTMQNLAKQRQDIDAALQMTPQGIQIADKDAFGRFMNEMPNVAGILAYHGTPHTIQGKFDINKVGTGEGAQAYGHGMYFAENPAVAKEYQKLDPAGGSLLPTRRTLNGVELESGTPEYHAATILSRNGMTLAQAKKDVQKWIAEGSQDPRQDKLVEGWNKTLETLQNNPKKSAFGELPHEGNLYKVDIPDEHIPNMMDYYKPLSEQPQAVKDVAMQYANGLKNQIGFKGVKSIWDLDGGDLYGVMQRYQLNDAGKLVKKNVDAKDVSDKLLNAGIPGIKYLDQGSLQQTDSYLAKHGGTKNFVVFEPSTVKILEENGKPLTRKELIEQQLNKVVE